MASGRAAGVQLEGAAPAWVSFPDEHSREPCLHELRSIEGRPCTSEHGGGCRLLAVAVYHGSMCIPSMCIASMLWTLVPALVVMRARPKGQALLTGHVAPRSGSWPQMFGAPAGSITSSQHSRGRQHLWLQTRFFLLSASSQAVCRREAISAAQFVAKNSRRVQMIAERGTPAHHIWPA